MSDLVTLAELKVYLGIDALVTTDDAVNTALLNDVEALFESATLRSPGFYTGPATDFTEVLDGTGCKRLYLSYPIDALTSITLGYDSSTTLNVSDRSVLVYGVGSRVVTRTDGLWFGRVGQSRYVEVVYDHLGNLPEDAKLAIMSVVASVYRNRGSEGMRSETVGAFYSYTRDDVRAATATDPFWQLAVQANSPVVLA